MNHSAEIDKIAAALVAVQGQLRSLPKPADNPYFHSKYTPLDVIWDSVRGIVAGEGIAVVQFPTKSGLETVLCHTSGQWMSNEAEWAVDTSNPQKIGSAITYMRRYGLCAALGITSADEDDDANSATGLNASPKSVPVAPAIAPKPSGPKPLIVTHIAGVCKAKGIKISPTQLAQWVLVQGEKILPDDSAKAAKAMSADEKNALFEKHQDKIKDMLEKEPEQIDSMLDSLLPF